MMRAQCAQYLRCANDPVQAEHADSEEPYQHDRPENVTDERGSLALNQEETHQDGDADRNDDRRELRCVELEPFHRTQDRYCWRDDAVAIEQRSANQPDNEQGGSPGSGWRTPHVEKRQ